MIKEIDDREKYPKPKLSDFRNITAIKAGDVSLKALAAIELRIPNSGIPWLDEMIAKAERRDITAKAMQGLSANPEVNMCVDSIADLAYMTADAMIKEREDKG